MLTTKNPRFTQLPPKKSEASKHLWDDFVAQVASYARRNNVAYGGLPPSERKQQNIATTAWYNKAPLAKVS